jgi:hypothetical protein
MTTAKDSKAAPAGQAKLKAKGQGGEVVGQVIGQAIGAAARSLAPPTSSSGNGLLGLSAAFVVGMAVGTAIGSDQPAASGADVRLPLDDDPPKGSKGDGHQADCDHGL